MCSLLLPKLENHSLGRFDEFFCVMFVVGTGLYGT